LSFTSHIKTLVSPAGAIELSVRPAESAALDRVHGAGWLAVGDAACSFDPLSSLGITHALRSGGWAASAIDDALRGASDALHLYGAKIDDGLREFERLKQAYYAAERRWTRNKFWARRHRRVADPAAIERPTSEATKTRMAGTSSSLRRRQPGPEARPGYR
jgi:flavin-dependent dehydrogenase